MKIVYSSRGSRGDVNPIIEVASILNIAGHETRLFLPELFKDYSRKLDLDPTLYPEDSMEVMQNMGSGISSLKGAYTFFSNSVEDQFKYMMDAAANADILVTTINEVAAPTIAEYYKIPHYRIGFSPILPGNLAPPFMPWQNMPAWVNRLGWKGMDLFSKKVSKKFIDPRRVKLGLEPVKNSRAYHAGNCHTILAINQELAPSCDTWDNKYKYKYDYTGYCYGQINGELDAELLDFIELGSPPVYIGFGSVIIKNPGEFTNIVIEAVEKTGCRVIVGQGWTGLGDKYINKDIFSVGETDHGSLFPKLAGIIHHGGSGTTHTAAKAGIPQFILPQFYDQYYWGNSIYKKGIGPKPIPPKKIKLKDMIIALDGLTKGVYRKAAKELSSRMQDEDGVKRIADIITDGMTSI